MLSLVQKQQKGFTLIEVMIGLAISLFLTMSAVFSFSIVSKSTSENVKAVRLSHELQSAMNIIVTDIRRSGYWGNAVSDMGTSGNTNPFMQAATDMTVNGSGNCITLSYDIDADGSIPALNTSPNDERFGYRLSGTKIQTRPEFYTTLDCSAAASAWIDLTDDSVISVTGLTFTVATENVPLSAGNLQRRTVDISITGQLVSDASITRTFQELVYIRNDKYAP